MKNIFCWNFLKIIINVFTLDCLLQTSIYYNNYVTWKGVYAHRNSICSSLQVFFIITCSFSVFVENCILLPKGINEFVVFLCIVYLWFWFFTLLPRFVLLVIKGQFFHRTKILFQSAYFFSYKNVASKSFYKSKIHPFPLMLMQRNEMWYTYTPLGI